MTTAATRLLALLGHPVSHSRSPEMITAACVHLGIDATYVACDVHPDRLREAILGLASLGAAGANVTVPHKIAAVAHCDELDAVAAAIGAVNTLRFEHGRVIGHNTDAAGAVRALESAGATVRGARAVVLGAGGAARAIASGLASAGAAHVAIRARGIDRARSVVTAIEACGGRGDAGLLTDSDRAIRSADVVVQATSAGMAGASDDAAIVAALEGARPGAHAMDAVYTPRETRWLVAARARGLFAVDGLGMLAAQAAEALAVWFGTTISPEILRRFLDADGRRG